MTVVQKNLPIYGLKQKIYCENIVLNKRNHKRHSMPQKSILFKIILNYQYE
jgi:hypothetical protein